MFSAQSQAEALFQVTLGLGKCKTTAYVHALWVAVYFFLHVQ